MTDKFNAKDADGNAVPFLTDTAESINGTPVSPSREVERIRIVGGPAGAPVDIDFVDLFNQLLAAFSAGTGTEPMLIPLGRNGVLSAGTGKMTFVATRPLTIVSIRASLGIGGAATGVPGGTTIANATVIADVNKVVNGVATTLFTTQANRPWFAAGSYDSGNKTPDVTALAAGDGLSFDIDQVGSSVQGSDISVSVELS